MVFDVAVVGGGPAGSSAAYWLAEGGVHVVLVDRSRFPRHKTCGGGVQAKAADLFGFSIDPVVERVVTRMRVSSRMTDAFTREATGPLVYDVMRDRFDSFLLEKARTKGATVIEGERVTAIEEGPNSVLVRTPERVIEAKLVIGADGAQSVVRNRLYPMLKLRQSIGVEAEVSVSGPELEAIKDTIMIDWGTLPGGYAWVFPKGDHLSIGAGGPLQLSGKVRHYLSEFLASLVDSHVFREYTVQRQSSHVLPMALDGNRLHTARTLLLGDAAGLIDPFSGEGIYYAVRSARIASDVICGVLGEKSPDLVAYTDEVASVLMPEINSARSLMCLFNLRPRAFHDWLRRSDRLWNAMTRSLSGDKTYVSWRGELGKMQFLWPLIDIVAGVVTERRIERAS